MPQEMSPVVKADVKFAGCPNYLHVDVRFRSKEEIDTLISALTRLRDTQGYDFDHVHLQDISLAYGRIVEAEVAFNRPGLERDELSMDMLTEAQKWLGKVAKKDRKKR